MPINKNQPKYLTILKQEVSSADLSIDGEIVTDEFSDSDTSAAGFRDLLKSLGSVKTINLHINSPGGSVFEGIAIENMLKQNSATVNVYVDGLAASIASVIAMAGDTIFMPKNSMMMIHNPWTMAMGNAAELRKQADDLDHIGKSAIQTYLNKAGDKLDENTLQDLLDNETWLTADEAVSYGLADEVIEANQSAASITPELAQHFKHMPKDLLKKPQQNNQKEINKLVKKANSRLALVNANLGGIK